MDDTQKLFSRLVRTTHTDIRVVAKLYPKRKGFNYFDEECVIGVEMDSDGFSLYLNQAEELKAALGEAIASAKDEMGRRTNG